MSKEISKDVETREPVKSRTEATREQALKKEQKGSQESKYPINELAANAKKCSEHEKNALWRHLGRQGCWSARLLRRVQS